MTKDNVEEFLGKLESLLKEYDFYLDFDQTGLEITRCYPASGFLKILNYKTEEEWGVDAFTFGWDFWEND